MENLTQTASKMSVIYYFLAFFVILQISKASPPKNHVFFQIDEFIKQLMTSEKFDELADVIADKAAQKIRDIDSPSNSHSGKSILRNLDQQDTADSKPDDKLNHERDYSNDIDLLSNKKLVFNEKNKAKETRTSDKSKHNHDIKKVNDLKLDEEKVNYESVKHKGKDSRLKEKSSYAQEKQKNKSSKSTEKSDREQKSSASHTQKKSENIDKIDTQTFLQNQLASKELELNFKHLKGEIEKHRFKLQKGNDKNKESEHSENNRAVENNEDEEEKNENNTIKKTLTQIDSKELLLSKGSNEKEAHEQATFHDQKKSTNSGENKSIFELETRDKIQSKAFKYDHNSNEKPIPRISKQNDTEEAFNSNEDIHIAKTFIDRVMDKVSQELNHPTYSSKEVLVVGINRVHSDESKTSAYSEKQKENISGDNKHFIDIENDKIATSKISAEYADSHEYLSIKPKFINTYK